MSVLSARGFGCGCGEGADKQCLKIDDLMDISEHTKLELFCNNDLVDMLVSVIDRTARTELRCNGKFMSLTRSKHLRSARGPLINRRREIRL